MNCTNCDRCLAAETEVARLRIALRHAEDDDSVDLSCMRAHDAAVVAVLRPYAPTAHTTLEMAEAVVAELARLAARQP